MLNKVMDWERCTEIEQDPAKLSGAPVFKGTRIPVRALFENLSEGATIKEFMDWFPGVTESQVKGVLLFFAREAERDIHSQHVTTGA